MVTFAFLSTVSCFVLTICPREKTILHMHGRPTHAGAPCPLDMTVSPPVMSASHVEDSVLASVGWRDCRRARRAVRGTLFFNIFSCLPTRSICASAQLPGGKKIQQEGIASRSTGCAETAAGGSPWGAELDAEHELVTLAMRQHCARRTFPLRGVCLKTPQVRRRRDEEACVP